MSLAQGNNTPTRPRIEPGSPDPESDALTTRPVRPPIPKCTQKCQQKFFWLFGLATNSKFISNKHMHYVIDLNNIFERDTEVNQ